MWLNGDQLPETDDHGRPLHDASYLVLFNAHHDVIEFTLPKHEGSWVTEVDTAFETSEPPPGTAAPRETYPVKGRSIVILREAPGTAT
jgi:glycogen operon protein